MRNVPKTYKHMIKKTISLYKYIFHQWPFDTGGTKELAISYNKS